VATPTDIEFLKLAVQGAVFDRPTAEKCLEIIDLGARRGKSLSAAQVAINLGFLDARTADALAARARSSQAGTQPHEEPSGAFALEGFRLEAKLGRGPCGATYDATRVQDGSRVALKVLSRKFARHPRTLQAVLDEARRAQGFAHENVAALREVIAVSGRDALVFERPAGATKALAAEIASAPLPTLRATEVAIELAKALVAAHARGLPHGDIRPAKVLVAPDGAVRLADFGMAHAACLAAGYGQSGVPFGHPEYLAPEVVQERLPRPTPATDIYALGVTLYELCCGHVPHRGATHRETLRSHLEAPLPPPPPAVHVSSALAEVILRLTAKDPKRRPADMKTVLHGLEDYKQKRLSGHTSDGEGESGEKKAPNQERITDDDWGKQSKDAGSHSGEWTAEKIETAERVGPVDLTGEEEESFEPGQMAAASTIPAAARAAARAVAEQRARVAAEAKSAPRPADPGSRASWIELDARPKPRGRRSWLLVLLVLLMLGALGFLGWLFLQSK